MQIMLLIVSGCIHIHNTYILSYFNFGLIKIECDPQNIFLNYFIKGVLITIIKK